MRRLRRSRRARFLVHTSTLKAPIPMTAEITFTAGKAEIAYTGDTPWWGGGQKLPLGASHQEWLDAAGMAWTIASDLVRFRAPDGTLLTDPSHVVQFRSDTFAPLGVVGPKFQTVQPREILEYFNNLAHDAGFQLTTAGTLFGGRKFWGQAENGAAAAVLDPRDQVKSHLLLATACDGSMSTVAKFVNTRVVCNNTLTLALGENGKQVKVSHKTQFNADFVNEALGLRAKEQFAVAMERFRAMATARVSPGAMVRATLELYEPQASELDEAGVIKALQGRQIGKILNQDLIGKDLDGGAGTVWAWLNAVTQYIDHDNGARTIDRRFQTALFGAGEATKIAADRLADQLLVGPLPPLAISNDAALNVALA